MDRENKHDIDIAVISEKVHRIESWVENADKNHFPSIEKRFDRIERKMAYYAGGLSVVIIVAQFIFK